MRDDQIVGSPMTVASGPIPEETSGAEAPVSLIPLGKPTEHPIYAAAWATIHVLLLLSILLTVYMALWEYSTRMYLKGFSDAVIPASATPEEKIEAILAWMSDGPARRPDPIGVTVDRDPTDTLNYRALLQVCGSATNAFINLADSSGLSARRLLLLGPDRGTRHVVAEVNLEGRWIVVDPTFRTILRGNDGQPLTRRDLADPGVFSAATQRIPDYDPSYNYRETEHVRMERIPFLGPLARKFFNVFLPTWQDTSITSLLLERESFAAFIASLLLLSFLILLRILLRWFGESRLGVKTTHIRERMRRAARVLMTSPT
jgi:Transglutaminase-like superfamily